MRVRERGGGMRDGDGVDQPERERERERERRSSSRRKMWVQSVSI